jgi:AcrR family transcriptional regulator
VSSPGTAGDPATRRRICEAALRLITREGGADITLSEVARAARVSRQALYLHFADRAALLLAVVQYADERRGLDEAIDGLRTAPTGVIALERMVAMQAGMNPGIWPLARVLDAVRRTDAAAEQSWQDRLAHRLEGCRAVAVSLAAEGHLRPDLPIDVATDLLWTMTSLRTWEDLVLQRGWTAEQYQSRVTDLLKASLLR